MATRTLTYILLGKDQLSQVAGKAAKNTESSGKAIKTAMVGASVAIAASLIPALAGAVGAAEESNKVAAQTTAVLKSTHGAAKVTAAGIGQLSSAIMKKTGIDDEAIRSGANMLLTFTNIRNEAGKGNDIFNQTTGAVTDMAAAMNGGNVTQENMRAMSVKVGKALNDPIKGMSALGKMGVQFTQGQKDQVKAMIASGDKMGAQKLILGELRKEFKGSAEAAATPFKKFKTSMGELQETVGNTLLPVLSKLATWLTDILGKFQSLPGPVRTIIVSLAGVVAVGIPMIMMFVKIKKAMKEFELASKLAAFSNPWVLLATAIVVLVFLIITHWNTVKKITLQVWGAVRDFVVGVWDKIKGAAETAFNWLKRNWPLILAILTGPIGLAVLAIVKHWDTIKHAAKVAFEAVTGAVKWMWEHGIRPVFKFLADAWMTVVGLIIHGAATAFGWVPGIGGKLKGAAKEFDKFKNNVNNSLSGINNKTVAVSVAMTAKSNPYPGGITGRAAAGGQVRGRGSGTSDTAGLFALSHEEWVVKASSANKYGTKAMSAVNEGKAVIGYADGGQVGLTVSTHTPTATGITKAVNAPLIALATKFAHDMMSGIAGVVPYAMQWLGKIPYVWGGTSIPGGADCSGFTQAMYKHVGINAPRTSEAQYSWAKPSGAIPGALAFYISAAGGPPPGHVAIVKDAHSVISQGGGMGPDIQSLHYMSLMGMGVPPGYSGSGGGFGNAAPGGGGSVGRWAGMVRQVLAMFGQPLYLVDTVLRRMDKESGGNPYAVNNWDSNAKAGHPSMGLMQTIMSTFLRFAGPFAGRGIFDPFANIYASFGYAMWRYGSLSAAFNRAGGYAGGTNSASRGWAFVGENGPELVNFSGGESVTANHRLGRSVIWTGDVVVQGHALASKQELARTVTEAIEYSQRHGNR